MDPTPNGTEPRMGLNPEWDWTPTGLNPDRDSTPNGVNPDWESTLTETELRMGLNLQYGDTMYTYIQRMDLKRELTLISLFQSKKRLSGPRHMNEFSFMLKKLETIKMFFTAVEIVLSSRGLIGIWGVESGSALSPFYSMLSPILSSVQSGRSSRLIYFNPLGFYLWSQLPHVKNTFSRESNYKKTVPFQGWEAFKVETSHSVLSPFCVESHFGVESILGWVPFGVKSILGWVPF